jgi:hypothetical protein
MQEAKISLGYHADSCALKSQGSLKQDFKQQGNSITKDADVNATFRPPKLRTTFRPPKLRNAKLDLFHLNVLHGSVDAKLRGIMSKEAHPPRAAGTVCAHLRAVR